jgi:predicted nucleic acid-binding protein
MLFDTTFVIDLQREATRRQPGRACSFLEANPDVPVRISVVTWGEFAEGFGDEYACADVLRAYSVIPLSEAIAWRCGQLSRELREHGERIGDNDLWIAATALCHDTDLVTRNGKHFRHVAGLRVRLY